MPNPTADLNLIEVPYASGAIRHRFAVAPNADGTSWVRHGLFVAYSETGVVLSEGSYVHGKEHGLWRDYHPNGQLAAEGQYVHGNEEGLWRFWNEQGAEERPTEYERGQERAA